MKNNVSILITTLIVGGCASTKMNNEYAALSVTDNELNTSKWSQLNRTPARYPIHAVIKSIEGCATIEYVITSQNEIKDVNVIASTNKYFAKAAVNVIENWNWLELPQRTISQAVKTQTRFDFCFDKPNQPCSSITPKYSCPSKDIIYSTGMRMKASN
jgi:hypothetical protein